MTDSANSHGSERRPDPGDTGPDGDDLDRDAREEALRHVGRRVLIWALPLTLCGALLVGLGIPVWISVIAMLAVLAVLVFEIDL